MIILPDCPDVAALFIPRAHHVHKLVVHHVVHAVHTAVDCLGGGGLGWGDTQTWSPFHWGTNYAVIGVGNVPEPSTTALLVLGFLMVGLLNRYRRAS